MQVEGRVAWHHRPIADGPRFSPRPATVHSFRAPQRNNAFMQQSRPEQLKGLYYSTVASGAFNDQDRSARYWDSFVAKQNARAVDTLSQYSATYLSPRHVGHAHLLSPRSHATKPSLESMLSPRAPGGTPATARPTLPSLVPLPPNYWNKPVAPPKEVRRRPRYLPPRAASARGKASSAAAPDSGAGAPEEAGPALANFADNLTKKQVEALVKSSENMMNQKFSDMWQAFKYVDVDSSGRVNREELARGLHLWGVNNPNTDGWQGMLQAADAVIKACDHDGDGSIDYKEFVAGLARDKFVGSNHTPKIKTRKVGDPLDDPLSKLKPGVTAEDLVMAHSTVRERLLNKHDTIHKAFKNMDMDGSGFINRSEFEGALKNLNVQLKKPVLDSLLDIIDVEDDDDGGDDHDIGFREFARVMTAADLFKMKALAPRPTSTTVDVREKARRDALQHLRPGVMQEELRKLHEQVRSRITAKYGKHSFSSAFKWIDADRTGSITREEFKEALKQLNLAGVREPILDTLCDFIDQDHSGSFGYSEFARVLSADDVMQMAPGSQQLD